MSIIARLEHPEATVQSPVTAPLGAWTNPGFDLVGCIRALDGWVAPVGLAPRAVLEDLVGQGRLEAWPGRPLYRAARRPATRPTGEAA